METRSPSGFWLEMQKQSEREWAEQLEREQLAWVAWVERNIPELGLEQRERHEREQLKLEREQEERERERQERERQELVLEQLEREAKRLRSRLLKQLTLLKDVIIRDVLLRKNSHSLLLAMLLFALFLELLGWFVLIGLFTTVLIYLLLIIHPFVSDKAVAVPKHSTETSPKSPFSVWNRKTLAVSSPNIWQW